MGIDTQTNQLLIVIKDGIEMLQEQISEKEVAIVQLVERVLRDGKLADTLSLMQVCFWLKFEDCLSKLEANWFDLLFNLRARFVNLTEGWISLAIEILHLR